jgi:UDP-4-amino-4,6-dideoxy-N-acetyl-beta-L-altrosamine transaminase
MNRIPYARQSINEADIAAVQAVLRSDYLTQGPAIEKFERRVADHCGARHAVAVSSATAALHLACLALDLKPGDRLWTSPNTFVASANCGLYCGAAVGFVDIDPRTYNLSVSELEKKLGAAKASGTLPKVVVAVHFAGQCCELQAIARLAKEYGFAVIEDASHALGGSYQDQPIGNCRYSDVTIFSFHPVKIITTGEGGMALTNRDDLREKIARLRTHGITRDPRFMTAPSDGPWHYQQLDLGFNYRLTDIQAALGLSQMDRLNQFIQRRRELAARYDEQLQTLPLTLPWQHPDTASSWHLYVVRLRLNALTRSHRQVFESLRDAGIIVNLHYIPIHTQPYYRGLGFELGDFPEAERYYAEAISLPLFYELSEGDQDQVSAALGNALEKK